MAESSRKKSSSAFRTIGEVSAELSLPTHVLRFWESKFSQIKPHKRRGGHRYYRPQDIEVLQEIKALLYDRGYTIKGAQKHLKDAKKEKVKEDQSALFTPVEVAIEKTAEAPTHHPEDTKLIKRMLHELVELRELLEPEK